MARALWQILIEILKPARTAMLDCGECFYYLEYLSELRLVKDEVRVMAEAIRRYVVNYPNCLEHHVKRLRELEESLEFRKQ